MKVKLVANLALNGELVLAEQAAAYTAPQEISGMGIAMATECGNVIMGYTTYKMFADAMREIFEMIEVVVLNSEELNEPVHTAKSAAEAVAYLEGLGYEDAIVCGGAITYSSFLKEGLADEIYFNLFPVVIGGGGTLDGATDNFCSYKLADVKSNGDVAMLHYVR